MFSLTAQPHDPILRQSLFYQSPNLDNGKHTLVVSSKVVDSAFHFGFFAVTPNVQKITENTPPPDTPTPNPPASDTQAPNTTTNRLHDQASETTTTGARPSSTTSSGSKTTVVVGRVTVTITPSVGPSSTPTNTTAPPSVG